MEIICTRGEFNRCLLSKVFKPKFPKQIDKSKTMKDLNVRIHQLTKLILTSQSVDETKGDDSHPGSPVKVNFDLSPYQVSGIMMSFVSVCKTEADLIFFSSSKNSLLHGFSLRHKQTRLSRSKPIDATTLVNYTNSNTAKSQCTLTSNCWALQALWIVKLSVLVILTEHS